jgi:hypothetical protein
MAVACSHPGRKAPDTGVVTPVASNAPTSAWAAALQKTPYPYTIPLPQPTRTSIDGTYAKLDPKQATPVPCKRCPDYAPEGGIWKLHLDRGIFRVFHQATGWHSLGSFVLAKDRRTAGADDQLVLFNDPACPGAVGLYRWQVGEGHLVLTEIEDPCSIRLRALNLGAMPWLSCQPPALEAGITEYWQKPPGCDDTLNVPGPATDGNSSQ